MKKFLIVLVVLALSAKAWFWYQKRFASAQDDTLDFSKPVYAELRGKAVIGDRTLEEVALIKAANAQDCETQMNMAAEMFRKKTEESGMSSEVTLTKQCQEALPPHLAITFDNTPSSDFTYVSVARSAPNEREMRIVYFGVTASESDQVCDYALTQVANTKVAATCIRPVR